MLGDIHFAEPGCLIAFAGKRVIQATVKEELSADFQTAEFVEKHGFVDRVINRKNLQSEIIVARAFKPLPVILNLIHNNFKSFKEVILFLGKNGNETSTNIEQSTKAAS